MDTIRDATTGITIGGLERSGVLIELCGEFDTGALESLREALDGASSSGLATYVDLSGVAFLDVRCALELAVRCPLHGDRLTLLNPSWQAVASFKACGFQGRIASCPGGDPSYWREFQERAESPTETLAV